MNAQQRLKQNSSTVPHDSMTITVRKAGEAIVKAAVGATGSGVRVPLRYPRAVSAAEAHLIEPARESTKVSLMPWKGWLS